MELAQTWEYEERNKKLFISGPGTSIEHQRNLKDMSNKCRL